MKVNPWYQAYSLYNNKILEAEYAIFFIPLQHNSNISNTQILWWKKLFSSKEYSNLTTEDIMMPVIHMKNECSERKGKWDILLKVHEYSPIEFINRVIQAGGHKLGIHITLRHTDQLL